MRHHDRSKHTHNNKQRIIRKSRSNPRLHRLSPADIHQKQLIQKRQADNRNKGYNPTFDLTIRIGQ